MDEEKDVDFIFKELILTINRQNELLKDSNERMAEVVKENTKMVADINAKQNEALLLFDENDKRRNEVMREDSKNRNEAFIKDSKYNNMMTFGVVLAIMVSIVVICAIYFMSPNETTVTTHAIATSDSKSSNTDNKSKSESKADVKNGGVTKYGKSDAGISE